MKTRMNVSAAALGLAAALVLGACSQEPEQVPADAAADKLDAAAAESDPQAAAVMRERAEAMRGMESVAPMDEPGSYTQDTMSKAGAAAAQDPTPAT